MSIKNPQPGQPIRASLIRQMCDSLNAGNDLLGTGMKGGVARLVVRAINGSETALEPMDAVVIYDQALSETYPQRQQYLCPAVRIPEAGDNLNAVAVVLEGIPSLSSGRVCIAGLVWAKCDGGSGVAGALSEASTELSVGASGPAQVIAQDSTGLYALVRIGAGGGSAYGDFELHVHEGWLLRAAE
jgi:hypothetical protein